MYLFDRAVMYDAIYDYIADTRPIMPISEQ
jgi:hypothetical protein